MLSAKNNTIVFDEKGIPSVMVRIERPKDAAVTPEMFIIGGKEADAIYISKYQNKVLNGRAYSLPMTIPTTSINFDEAVQACRAKGEGWHLMTAVEWEYILDQNGEENVLPYYGNEWEWLAGIRIKDGAIEYIPNNDAALEECDLSRDSREWRKLKTGADGGIAKSISPRYGGAWEWLGGFYIAGSRIERIQNNDTDRESKFDIAEGEWLPVRWSAVFHTDILHLSRPRSRMEGGGFRSCFYEANGKLITK